MVVPGELQKHAYVPNPVRIKIIDAEAIFLLGILGESGRKLVEAGIEFWFEDKLARKLIRKGIAKEVDVAISTPGNARSFKKVTNEPNRRKKRGGKKRISNKSKSRTKK
jgi:hypothetical protein